MTAEELIAFEEEIKDLFLEKRIRCPIHLSGGNEQALIEVFRKVKPEDWVFSTHRSHYHALLKGISPEWLKAEILDGRSMQIMNPEARFFSSSIVAGILPIAVGRAMAVKRSRGSERVWCFVGDMASEGGAFYESTKYASHHELPVTFVIEDNGFSTDTPTAKVWGLPEGRSINLLRVHVRHEPPVPFVIEDNGIVRIIDQWLDGKILYYRYQRTFPHVGCGEFVHF